MRTFNSTITSQMDVGITDLRQLVRFDFGVGSYGFVRGIVPVDYGGLRYYPTSLISASDLGSAPGTSAQDFTVTLALSTDDSGVIIDAGEIYSLGVIDRPVTIMDAHFNTTTGELIDVIPLRKGKTWQLDQKNDPQNGPTLVANCMSTSIDYSKVNGHTRSQDNQKRRLAPDRFFSAEKPKISWGRETP